MNLEKMFQWRMKATHGQLWKWYIVIGTGLLLLFVSGCASDGSYYRDYHYEMKCHAENEIQYCRGHSRSHLDCVCILRRDIG